MSISFSTTKAEAQLISQIADRADAMFAEAGANQSKMDTVMDLSACVANGCPLKLAELLAADDFNFAHDVGGIRRHINRTTGKLENCFLPRFAQKE